MKGFGAWCQHLKAVLPPVPELFFYAAHTALVLYEIPVYSVLLNLLVLPFMSVVMAGGILSLIPGLGIAGTVDCPDPVVV